MVCAVRVFVYYVNYYVAFQSGLHYRVFCISYEWLFHISKWFALWSICISYEWLFRISNGLCCARICVSYEWLFCISKHFGLLSGRNNRNQLLFCISNRFGLRLYSCIIPISILHFKWFESWSIGNNSNYCSPWVYLCIRSAFHCGVFVITEINCYSAFQSGMDCRVFLYHMDDYSVFHSGLHCGVVVIELNYCAVFQSR